LFIASNTAANSC